MNEKDLEKMKKTVDMTVNIVLLLGLIIIIVGIISDIYKNIKITNKIENPSLCIEINDDYYCRVQEKDKTTRIIEA